MSLGDNLLNLCPLWVDIAIGIYSQTAKSGHWGPLIVNSAIRPKRTIIFVYLNYENEQLHSI
jgi:hypothetical protein